MKDIKYAFAYASSKMYPNSSICNFHKKDESHYLYKKDDELKGENITDENEGIIENGNDFNNCKIISA